MNVVKVLQYLALVIKVTYATFQFYGYKLMCSFSHIVAYYAMSVLVIILPGSLLVFNFMLSLDFYFKEETLKFLIEH